MYSQLINDLVIKYKPFAIFLGGSQGCKMTTARSDIDIILIGDKLYTIKNAPYHCIGTTIEKDMCNCGMLYIENLLYVCSQQVENWFQQWLKILNIVHLYNNSAYLDEYYHCATTYKIISFYNYYYNDNKLLNIREPDCQYHEDYEQIIRQLKTDLKDISIDKKQLIKSFYDTVRGDK